MGKGLYSTVFWASLGVVPEIDEDGVDEISIGTGVPSLLRYTSTVSLSRLRCTSRLPREVRIGTVR